MMGLGHWTRTIPASGLGGRFALLYFQVGQDPVQIPLQAVPSQQFDITLGGQNCTFSFYQK